MLPTLNNGGILLPILVIVIAACYAGARRMVDNLHEVVEDFYQDAHTNRPSPKE